MICKYVANGIRVIDAVRISGMKKSTYYYQPNGRKKGKSPSTHTLRNGVMVPNEAVVQEITRLIDPEYHDYGYQVTTDLLKQLEYIINHKKVYRLMDENSLLHPPTKKSAPLNKTFIKYTVPPLEGPFKMIEADIKYVYIHEKNRNAFLITFLCTFCRYAPVWDLQYSMKNEEIGELIYDLIYEPEVKRYLENQKIKVLIRTDNGPQFIARQLAAILESLGISHEFIRPGTPQQNAHIESFHNTVTRLVCNKNIFQDIEHAREIFKEFYKAYNETRVMKCLLCYPPKKFLKLWESGIIGIKKNKKNKEIFFFREKPHPTFGFGSSPEVLFGINKYNILESSVLKPFGN